MINKYYRLRRKIDHLRGKREAVEKWSFLMTQRKILPLLQNNFNENVPPRVNIEINNSCNYKCPFCPQSTIKRPDIYIAHDDFSKIISDLHAINYTGELLLSVNNEPFLHPGLIDYCQHISESLPQARTILITNGSLLSESRLKALSQLKHPPGILLDDYTPGHKVIKKISSMKLDACEIHLADAMDSTRSLSQAYLFPDNGNNKLQIMCKRRSWDETLSNRAGNQDNGVADLSYYHKLICTWPFYGMFISPSMDVFLCCSDYKQEVVLGNLRQQSIMEIWTSNLYRNIRNKMLHSGRGALDFCKKCDAEWYFLPAHCVPDIA